MTLRPLLLLLCYVFTPSNLWEPSLVLFLFFFGYSLSGYVMAVCRWFKKRKAV